MIYKVKARVVRLSRNPRPPLPHGGTHRSHDIRQTRRHRLPDQEMTDVEFDDLGQRRDRFGRFVVEAMAGMAFEAEASGMCGAVTNAHPFLFSGCSIALGPGLAPG